MKGMLHTIENPYEKDFNMDFITAANDYSLTDLVIMIMKDTEIIKNIHIESYEIDDNYDEIDYRWHDVNINLKRKDPYDMNVPNYKYMIESYYSKITFTIRIETNINTRVIKKSILIPKLTDDGYFIINNKKARAIWQLVEASVYTQRGKITLKSRMPIIMYKTVTKDMVDTEGNSYSFKPYSYAMDATNKKRSSAVKSTKRVNNKFINPFIIFSAKMGLRQALKFMCIDELVSIYKVDEIDEHDRYAFIPLNDMFIRVDKIALENELLCSLVGMLALLQSSEFPVTWDNLDNRDYWISRIGIVGSKHDNKALSDFKNKGYTTLMMIERLLDNMTIRNLRLPDGYKGNVYEVLRWMIVDFDELKMKDNIDINNKRVRKNEYIVKSTLGRKINDNINRVITHRSESRQNTIDTLLEIFNFPDNIILNGMRIINDLIKSEDITNDFTIIEDLAYSSKGPEALGDDSSKNVMVKLRDVHPSFMGKIDCEVISNSDIGMTGSFVPYVKTYDGFYFDPNKEPDEHLYETLSEFKDIMVKPDNSTVINFTTGEILDLPNLDFSDKDKFNESIKNRDEKFGIVYEPIEIVEHVDEKVIKED
jgi:hypothetical protein